MGGVAGGPDPPKANPARAADQILNLMPAPTYQPYNWRLFLRFLRVAVLVVIVIWAIFFIKSTFFTVAADEEAVITRLGAYNRTVGPGLHLKWPMGIETLYRVPIKRQMKLEFGFRSQKTPDTETRTGGSERVRTRYAEAPGDEAEILTGDLFVIHLEWSTQFHITNPKEWLFNLRDPLATFADLNEAVMREVVGDRTFGEALTTGRSEIQSATQQSLQDRCKLYQLPIAIDQVILQDVRPPDSVKAAFTEVNGAMQERETTINTALKEYNAVVPKAEGQAKALISQAQGYAAERTNNAFGEVARFNAVFSAYTTAPEITRTRLYLEAMARLATNSTKKIIVDDKLPSGFIYAPALGR
jgi:membrane protease subunit HflK